MATYTNYKVGVISICNYLASDPSVVNHSEVMVDYPMILGPDEVYDQIDIQMKPWGRHPATELPLFVNEDDVDRWTGIATQNGVTSLSQSKVFPTPLDNPIDASLVEAGLNTAGSVAGIDGDAKYLAWGMWKRGEANDQEALPPSLRFLWLDEEVNQDRKDLFDTFMEARGTSSSKLSSYWAANPNATYRDVGLDFEYFIE